MEAEETKEKKRLGIVLETTPTSRQKPNSSRNSVPQTKDGKQTEENKSEDENHYYLDDQF